MELTQVINNTRVWMLISIALALIIYFILSISKKSKLYKFYLTDFKGGVYEYALRAFTVKEAKTKLITFFFLKYDVTTVIKTHYKISLPIVTGKREDIAVSDIFLHISHDRSFGRIITGIGTDEDKKWFEKLISNLNIKLDENDKRRIQSGSSTIC